jgi:hypothetical protein
MWDCLVMLVRVRDRIGPSDVKASAVTAPSTAANSDLARPRNVAFGSFPDVQAAQRHGRSTRGDLAIRHRRGANVFDALGSISGPAGKRPSYRQIVRSAKEPLQKPAAVKV